MSIGDLPLNWLCQTEVQDFNKPVGPNHHVLRLNIAMHYAGPVRRGQSIRDLKSDAHRFFQTHLPLCDLLPQGLAGHKFSSDKMHILIPPDLVNGDDIRMIERGDSASFPLKALHLCIVLAKLGWQDLDCNPTVEHLVMREINLTHPARAEQRLNLVVADPSSD